MRRALLPLLLSVAACRSTSAPPPPAPPPLPALPSAEHALAPVPNVAVDAPVEEAAVFVPETSLAPLDRSIHDQALADVRDQKWYAAKRVLARLVWAYPDRPRLIDQYRLVVSHIESAQRDARNALEAATLQALPAPPWKYHLETAAPADLTPIPALKKRSERPNHITDDDAWFVKNAIHIPEYFIPPPGDFLFAPNLVASIVGTNFLVGFSFIDYGLPASAIPDDLPASVPVAYGTLALRAAYASPPYTLCLYGTNVLAVFDGGKTLRGLFDFSAFALPPSNKHGGVVVGDVTLANPEHSVSGILTSPTDTVVEELEYAAARGNVLYVQHWYNGYTKEAKGQTGYLTAIDLDTGRLLWRSAPMVANARTFVVHGSALFTAYGFTAEPRFLYVIDASTGAVKQKQSIRATPEILVGKDDLLYVRAYDTDYVYDVR